MSKRDRAYELALEHLSLHLSSLGWPYARAGEQVYRFDASGKAGLCAELRRAWRLAHRPPADDTPDPDPGQGDQLAPSGQMADPAAKTKAQSPPDDRTLASVVADLKMEAEHRPVDGPEDAAWLTAWLEVRGVSAGPGPITTDRGLASLIEIAGCPVPDAFAIPAPYAVAPGGVWLWTPRGEAERICWGALLITECFTDPEGEQMVNLSWLHRGRWVNRKVSRSTAKSGRLLVKELGNAGLPVTDADAKAAERWLAALETHNASVITEQVIARSLGWQADGTFVTSGGSPYPVEVAESQLHRPLVAHHTAGTLRGWQEAVKVLAEHPLALMGVYAGLAAPLLDVLGLSSFTINWSGTSTTGKTTAAQGGLSAWADPDEAAGAIASWRSTGTGFEARLALAGSGVPVLFDDTQTARRPEDVSALLYQITQNQGKGRMGDWRTYRWRTIVMSTGERSALSFSTHQGVSARVLDLQGAPFGRGPDAGQHAAYFRQQVTANYGHAGPAFVRQLQAYVTAHGTQRLADRHADCTDLHRGEDATPLAKRRAPLVAALRLAAELGHAWKILPLPPPDDDIWLELFTSSGPADNRAELALDVVRDYVVVNGHRLWSHMRSDLPPGNGWIGKRTSEAGDDDAIALVPTLLKEHLTRAGYEFDAVWQGWRELKALHQRPKQKNAPYSINQRIGETQTRCYIFAGWVFTGEQPTQ